jgi:hypothetical protein
MEDLRYPIGEFTPPPEMTTEHRARFVDQIAELPSLLRRAVAGLTPAQLDTPYRPGGWTVRQVVHHIPDSHLNGYARMKLALTEDLPTIKPYDQEGWLAISDFRVPIEASLSLLEGLHALWAGLLRSLSEEQWRRGFIHPELVGRTARDGEHEVERWRRLFAADERGVVTIQGLLPTYAWHGRHHVAHITALRERMGWR